MLRIIFHYPDASAHEYCRCHQRHLGLDTRSWNHHRRRREAFAIIGTSEYDAQIDTSVLDPNSTMNGAYFFIEDVSIRPCPVGLNELSENFPRIGPNPFEDVVSFVRCSQPVYWELFDAFGRIVEASDDRERPEARFKRTPGRELLVPLYGRARRFHNRKTDPAIRSRSARVFQLIG
ncbi:hypothetical protein [Candidatus Pollutiaquabacter sp.]|uniref:hypothetical protein n=1 Tax=Candidatus Pollutiaquabacter sp. TaxID=3416354 RepID=UPI003CAF38EA|nr:hypothetical protein [Bacteroidota bacterium]